MTLRSLIMALLVCACGSTPPARFYLMSPVTGNGAGAKNASSRDVSVEIASVDLPRYLAAPRIITRASANELRLAEYDRWAEPLDENFARCLATNLAQLIPSRRIARAPWERVGTHDFILRVAVDRFDVQDGHVILNARWSLAGQALEGGHLVERSEIEHAVGGAGFASIARAMSQALGELSERIATAIKTGVAP